MTRIRAVAMRRRSSSPAGRTVARPARGYFETAIEPNRPLVSSFGPELK
jgi:hypothetical protein